MAMNYHSLAAAVLALAFAGRIPGTGAEQRQLARAHAFGHAGWDAHRRRNEEAGAPCSFCFNDGVPTKIDTGNLSEYWGTRSRGPDGIWYVFKPKTCRDFEADMMDWWGDTDYEHMSAGAQHLCAGAQTVTAAYCGCPESPPGAGSFPEAFCSICPDGSGIPMDKLTVRTRGFGFDLTGDGSLDDEGITCADVQLTFTGMPDVAYEEGGANLTRKEELQWFLWDYGMMCPVAQTITSGQCGCPASPERTCPICPSGLVDPDVTVTSPLTANTATFTCGSFLANMEANPAGAGCDRIRGGAPRMLELFGCACAEEGLPVTASEANGETQTTTASPPQKTSAPTSSPASETDKPASSPSSTFEGAVSGPAAAAVVAACAVLHAVMLL